MQSLQRPVCLIFRLLQSACCSVVQQTLGIANNSKAIYVRVLGLGLLQDGDVGVGAFNWGRKSLLSASALDNAC